MHRRDPMPDAPRGTLEYAASAAACVDVVRIELTFDEARKFEAVIDIADFYAVPGELVAFMGALQRALEPVLDQLTPQE